jgi:hypothetical protein
MVHVLLLMKGTAAQHASSLSAGCHVDVLHAISTANSACIE